MIKQDKFWNSHYKKRMTPKSSSKFAKFIFKNFLKEGYEFSLFDVGCGNGRDTFFFLQKGINCIGIDKSQIVINKNKDKDKKYNKSFINTDFTTFLFDANTKKNFQFIKIDFTDIKR